MFNWTADCYLSVSDFACLQVSVELLLFLTKALSVGQTPVMHRACLLPGWLQDIDNAQRRCRTSLPSVAGARCCFKLRFLTEQVKKLCVHFGHCEMKFA